MIEIKNLSYLHILKNISFQIEKNSFLSVLGANGSGKTTVLKCICGIYNNFKGDILIENNNIRKMSAKALANFVSYVPQIVETNIPFKVIDFLKMSTYAKSVLDREKENTSLKVLELLELTHFKERVVSSLSGGELQKILLAAALVQDTDYLLLDEPTSHLDPLSSFEMVQTLKKIKNIYKKGIVMVSHRVDEVLALSNKVIALKKGEIILQKEKTDKNELYLKVYNLKEGVK
jgi:iron complex transport system ATP-binding protein